MSFVTCMNPALQVCRFFLQNWPQLCWFAFDGEQCFGVVVCKTEYHRDLLRGYVGMLVVLQEYRGLGVGTSDFPHAHSNWLSCLKSCHYDKWNDYAP